MPQQYYTVYLWNCHSTNMKGITMLVCLSCGLLSSAQLQHGKNRFATGDTKSLSPSARDETIENEIEIELSGGHGNVAILMKLSALDWRLRTSERRLEELQRENKGDTVYFALPLGHSAWTVTVEVECPASHNWFPQTQPKRPHWERWRGGWPIDWSKRRPVWRKWAGTSQV